MLAKTAINKLNKRNYEIEEKKRGVTSAPEKKGKTLSRSDPIKAG